MAADPPNRRAMMSPDQGGLAMSDLTPEEGRALVRALRRPMGRYTVDRASQLSGVPRSTLYHWAKVGHLVPDFGSWDPMQWSYRDLVLSRLFVRIRSKGMAPAVTSAEVKKIRRDLSRGTLDPTSPIRATKIGVFTGDRHVDRLTGAQAMPTVLQMLDPFYLDDPVDDDLHMWGPSLVRPSHWTALSPGVVGGEPTIRMTRIPTAALYALNVERGLDDKEIAGLYEVGVAAVTDGLGLERAIRGDHRLVA